MQLPEADDKEATTLSHLGEAQNAVEQAGPRRRAMERKLRGVEALPEAAARDLLAISTDELIGDDLTEETSNDERRVVGLG